MLPNSNASPYSVRLRRLCRPMRKGNCDRTLTPRQPGECAELHGPLRWRDAQRRPTAECRLCQAGPLASPPLRPRRARHEQHPEQAEQQHQHREPADIDPQRCFTVSEVVAQEVPVLRRMVGPTLALMRRSLTVASVWSRNTTTVISDNAAASAPPAAPVVYRSRRRRILLGAHRRAAGDQLLQQAGVATMILPRSGASRLSAIDRSTNTHVTSTPSAIAVFGTQLAVVERQPGGQEHRTSVATATRLTPASGPSQPPQHAALTISQQAIPASGGQVRSAGGAHRLRTDVYQRRLRRAEPPVVGCWLAGLRGDPGDGQRYVIGRGGAEDMPEQQSRITASVSRLANPTAPAGDIGQPVAQWCGPAGRSSAPASPWLPGPPACRRASS